MYRIVNWHLMPTASYRTQNLMVGKVTDLIHLNILLENRFQCGIRVKMQRLFRKVFDFKGNQRIVGYSSWDDQI